jgi:hypothetical protein
LLAVPLAIGCSNQASLDGTWIVEGSTNSRYQQDWIKFGPGETMLAHFHVPVAEDPQVSGLLVEMTGKYTLVGDKLTMYAEELRLGMAGDVPGIDSASRKMAEDFRLEFNSIGQKTIEWEGPKQMRLRLPTGVTWSLRKT